MDDYPWYEFVSADAPVTQGDIVFDCVVTEWAVEGHGAFAETSGQLDQKVRAFLQDVVVMTQACDLEQNKVRNVILCPHYTLEDFREDWRRQEESAGNNPTDRSWSRHVDSICEGRVCNLAILNKSGDSACSMDHRVVDFHEIFSVPRAFLEEWLRRDAAKPRPRLRPPYREHLSQAFARYFMRVGLPVSIDRDWRSA